LISRLEAAPTFNITCSFRITRLKNSFIFIKKDGAPRGASACVARAKP
jgi:hypothetical protein